MTWSDLILSSYLGLSHVVKEMLKNENRNINPGSRRYISALHAASDKGHLEMVQVLLDNGADVNAHGVTNALYSACRHGYKDIVQTLINHGVNLNAEAPLALLVACYSGYKEIVQMILDNGADVNHSHMQTPLEAASASGHK